jgi:hypothetical protein
MSKLRHLVGKASYNASAKHKKRGYVSGQTNTARVSKDAMRMAAGKLKVAQRGMGTVKSPGGFA